MLVVYPTRTFCKVLSIHEVTMDISTFCPIVKSISRAPTVSQAFYFVSSSILGPPPLTSSSASWLTNFGALHHISFNLQKFASHFEYSYPDEVVVDNGSTLPITCTIRSISFLPHNFFMLLDVLCVTNMKCNLLSFSKFRKTN